MDLDDFRMILSNSRVDVWGLIDAAITVASLDYGHDLKDRRDGIVERLYATSNPLCRNCDVNVNHHHRHQHQQHQLKAIETTTTATKAAAATVAIEREIHHHQGKRGGGGGGEEEGSPSTPQSIHRDDDDDDDEEPDPYGGLFDDEQTKILRIKELLEDPDQSEESVVELLQSLADMDITFKALKETDIGRHVNRLRKHSSNDVRRLVKQLVREWKDLVDDWVRLNPPAELGSSTLIGSLMVATADGDSPQQKIPRNPENGHHHHHHQQVPDFAHSPNPHNGSSGSERNNSEPEHKPKANPRREAPTKPPQSLPLSASAPPPNRSHKETSIDLERLASARRRLHENYQEAENAKKQRTIQVMDIHEIPKPKNAYFAKNKGGFQGRQHR